MTEKTESRYKAFTDKLEIEIKKLQAVYGDSITVEHNNDLMESVLGLDMCRFCNILNPLLLEKYYFVNDIYYTSKMKNYEKTIKQVFPNGRIVLEFPIEDKNSKFYLKTPFYPYILEREITENVYTDAKRMIEGKSRKTRVDEGKTVTKRVYTYPLKEVTTFAQYIFNRITNWSGDLIVDLLRYKSEIFLESVKKCLICNIPFEFASHRPTLCYECSKKTTTEIETRTWPIQFSLIKGEFDEKTKTYIPTGNPNRLLWDSFVESMKGISSKDVSLTTPPKGIASYILDTDIVKGKTLLISRTYLPSYRVISEYGDNIDEYIAQSIITTGLNYEFHGILDHVILANPVVIERIDTKGFEYTDSSNNIANYIPKNWELYYIGQENELKIADFKNRVKAGGGQTEWFFHGGAFDRWYPILRNGGLKNLSGTAAMANAQAYGPGVYLSKSSAVSIGYSSINIHYTVNSNVIVGIVEAVKGKIEEVSRSQNYWVARDDRDICLRFLLAKRYNVDNSDKTEGSILGLKAASPEFLNAIDNTIKNIDLYVQ